METSVSRKPTVGITTYNYSPEDILNLAVHADRLGFEGLWFGEHYVIPENYGSHHPTKTGNATESAIISPTIRIYDPWFLLGAVAGATKRLKIGTAICIVPLNNPLLLARHTTTAHDISGGRFLFGTGAGWLKEEFDALGVPFNERGSRLDETIAILRKAWAGGYFAHEGKHFQFESLQISPHPVKVPLVCGGNTGPALRRVAGSTPRWSPWKRRWSCARRSRASAARGAPPRGRSRISCALTPSIRRMSADLCARDSTTSCFGAPMCGRIPPT
jgi:probable F420-dependent oxidoreductase